MSLVTNWRKLLRHAWSVHLNISIVLLMVLIGVDNAFSLISDYLPFPVWLVAVIGGVLSASAIGARLLYQKKVHDDDDK